MSWVVVVLGGMVGAGAGGIGRWALSRACPPAPVPRGSCEIGTALLWATALTGTWLAGWPSWWLPVPLTLGALAVPLVVADLRHHRLPDTLTLPAYPALGVALAAAALAAPAHGIAVRAACAALVFGGAHAAVRAWAPAALGAGDVKLAGSLGAVLGALGWAALPVAACLAALCSALLAAGAALVRHRAWRHGVPHGPGLLTAAWLLTMFPPAVS